MKKFLLSAAMLLALPVFAVEENNNAPEQNVENEKKYNKYDKLEEDHKKYLESKKILNGIKNAINRAFMTKMDDVESLQNLAQRLFAEFEKFDSLETTQTKRNIMSFMDDFIESHKNSSNYVYIGEVPIRLSDTLVHDLNSNYIVNDQKLSGLLKRFCSDFSKYDINNFRFYCYFLQNLADKI